MWIDDLLHASGGWALVALGVLVFADSLLVLIPGEIAVTALAAIAFGTGAPPVWSILVVAACAAFCGDAVGYWIGASIGVTRWRWMRGKRVVAAISWAQSTLHRGAATAVFTARFIPFARLALNLTAGATRLPLRLYAPLACVACIAWATYQTLIGATLGALIPGNPLVAAAVSIVVAVAIGVSVDVLLRLARRKNTSPHSPASPPSK